MLSLPRTKLNQKAIDKLVTANWPFIRVLYISHWVAAGWLCTMLANWQDWQNWALNFLLSLQRRYRGFWLFEVIVHCWLLCILVVLHRVKSTRNITCMYVRLSLLQLLCLKSTQLYTTLHPVLCLHEHVGTIQQPLPMYTCACAHAACLWVRYNIKQMTWNQQC